MRLQLKRSDLSASRPSQFSDLASASILLNQFGSYGGNRQMNASTYSLLLLSLMGSLSACAPANNRESAPSDFSPKLFAGLVPEVVAGEAAKPEPTPEPTQVRENNSANVSANKSDVNAQEKTSDQAAEKPVVANKNEDDSNDDDDANQDVTAMWDGHDKQSDEWTAATGRALETIGNGMLESVPSDIKYYCPKYAKLDREDRKAFWIQLISAIARRESDFNEDLRYKEKFNDSSNTRVVSRGLLQLSKESANLYGCQIEVGSQLESAARNLRCGVRILNKWIVRDGMIKGGERGAWRGAARFWSVFRTPDPRHFIQRATMSLDICK